MSDIVKSFRQKQDNNTFTEKINFSSDSRFINTFSGLNLEEELKLGGLNTITIVEQNGVTIITETATRSSNASSGYCVVMTAIKEKTDTTIILKWFYSDSSNLAKITIIPKEETSTISEYYIDPNKIDSILESWGVSL